MARSRLSVVEIDTEGELQLKLAGFAEEAKRTE